jgi:hypothetical protein
VSGNGDQAAFGASLIRARRDGGVVAACVRAVAVGVGGGGAIVAPRFLERLPIRWMSGG